MINICSKSSLRATWYCEKTITLPRRPFSTTPISTKAHVLEKPIEEALIYGYRLNQFHQTRPGEVLCGRFKTIAKLGYGTSSTVWLAENLEFKWWKNSGPQYVSIKIAARDTDPTWEKKASQQIADADPTNEGLAFLRLPIEAFELKVPDGVHCCLVYEPMRETLHELQQRLRRQRLAPPLFKFFIYCLLEGLDYLHTKCHFIHTDIKDDNIMVAIEKDSVLTDFVKSKRNSKHPYYKRPEDNHVTYLSQGDLGPLQGARVLPKLGDFNLAFPQLEKGTYHLSPIQSHRYRAPEVLLGCPWSYSVDIWNLGLLMWDLLEDTSLFSRPAGDTGEYDAHTHLAQMVTLLGPPADEIIEREQFFRKHLLEKPITNWKGNIYRNMNEFWGGPFFNDQGQILRTDLVGTRRLADTVTEMKDAEKEEFLDFASGMIHWLPEKRKSARELLEHPMFDELNRRRAEHS